MSAATIALTAHVVVAFAAVAFLVVPGAILEMVAATRDVPTIRKTFGLASFHGKIGGPLAILILPLGIWAAMALGVPLGTRWLVVAYVLYALTMVIGIGYHSRREISIAMLAQKSPDDAPSPELAAVIDDPKRNAMFAISSLLWLALIVLMVAQPF